MPDLVRGKTRKVVQLVGEMDRDRHGHPPQTFTKYRLYGTDLGTPLDFGSSRDLWFLFGDAWTAVRQDDGSLKPKIDVDDNSALTPPYNKYHPFNADPVGIAPPNVTAQNLDKTFELDFFMAPEPDRDQGYATLEIPGVTLLTNKVPTGAICTPSGDVYVFATGKEFHPGWSVGGNPEDPQCSWVARWCDLTILKTKKPYRFSAGSFANYLVPVIGGVADGTGMPGHPTEGEVVWLWGTGLLNRKSNVRLAYVPLTQIDNRSAWRFFHRSSTGYSWDTEESKATRLFNDPQVGEFSVAWNRYLSLWLMLYNSSNPRGILCRWADKPWGPWSKGIIVFDPWSDGGYGHFMHALPKWLNGRHDCLHDRGRSDDPGGEYAPIMIPRYTLGSGRSTTIRYTMSTWNPYTVVIMESELRLRREGIFTILTRAWENALSRVASWIRRLAR